MNSPKKAMPGQTFGNEEEIGLYADMDELELLSDVVM